MYSKKQSIIKNSKISTLYGISRPTVGKWLSNAIEGKNELQVTHHNGRMYILNTPHNISEIQKLKEHGIKYRNKIHFESKTADEEFIGLYPNDTLIELITNLENTNTLPLKYSLPLIKKENHRPTQTHFYSRTLSKTIAQSFASLINKYSEVTIYAFDSYNSDAIDILFEELKASNKKIKIIYIFDEKPKDAVVQLPKKIGSIKPEFLTITNNYSLLRTRLFQSRLNQNSCNVVLMNDGQIGSSTPEQQKQKLTLLRTVMSKGDFLVIDNGLVSRKILAPRELADLENRFKYTINLLEMIKLHKDHYVLLRDYDHNTHTESVFVRLKKNISLNIPIGGKMKTLNFSFGDKIKLWSYSYWDHSSYYTDLYSLGFVPLSHIVEEDGQWVSVVCGL